MSTVKYTPRLATKYSQDVIPALMKKFSYGSVMQAPRLEKICINRGVNGAVSDKKLVDIAVEELSMITGKSSAYNIQERYIQFQTAPGYAHRCSRNFTWFQNVRVSRQIGFSSIAPCS